MKPIKKAKEMSVKELASYIDQSVLKPEFTQEDIKAVCDVCHKYGTAVKIIFETDALILDEVKKATEVAIAAGADFVKTSTGFFTGGRNDGATAEVIQAMSILPHVDLLPVAVPVRDHPRVHGHVIGLRNQFGREVLGLPRAHGL